MPRKNSVLVVGENRPEQRFLEALLKKERQEGLVEVEAGLGTGGALGLAKLSLLKHPERPVAVVLNTDSTDPVRVAEDRATVARILAWAAPTGWHVALGVPRVDAWVMAVPEVRAAFEADAATRGENAYYQRAVRFEELMKKLGVGPERFAQAEPEFRKLYEFIQAHARQPSGAAK